MLDAPKEATRASLFCDPPRLSTKCQFRDIIISQAHISSLTSWLGFWIQALAKQPNHRVILTRGSRRSAETLGPNTAPRIAGCTVSRHRHANASIYILRCFYTYIRLCLYTYMDPAPYASRIARTFSGSTSDRRSSGAGSASTSPICFSHRCTSCHAPSFQLAARSVPTSSKPIFSCR